MPPRYLTKSRFKMGLECPTKLFYTGKQAFSNARSSDAFMQALADGGFQVGELAKLMHPGGIDIKAIDHDTALRETAALLARDSVTLFEAAIRFENLFVRIDVLVKTGTHFELKEVKARSHDRRDGFTNARGAISADMLPYLQDVAFQVHVLRAAYPDHTVSASLVMADKTARATVDQLNQRFKIRRHARGHTVEVQPGTDHASIGAHVLSTSVVTEWVDQILAAPVKLRSGEQSFDDTVAHLSTHYQQDRRIDPVVGTHCGQCEFRSATPDARSGFHLCWKEVTGWEDDGFAAGTVLDLWNCRSKDKLIAQGKFGLHQVEAGDLKLGERGTHLTQGERQWMQVSGQWPDAGDYYLDRAGLHAATRDWTYPLHFIDFETSRTAIPFHIGRRPYEQIAFQFSHHIMQADGSVQHAGQFLDARPGVFPNVAFVRALHAQLSGDEGTILRWATHENSVLRDIWRQLDDDPSPPNDKVVLQSFIDTITSTREHTGQRTMVDLCKLAEHYYFHPATRGSCSIKKVLPAVLASSSLLREKYARADYGTAASPSLNFSQWMWWQAGPDGSRPRDPYTLLPPVFDGGDQDDPDEELANGGAAMTAYARLQFEALGENERAQLNAALLKYCELDTLAMVMVWEAWRAELENSAGTPG